MAILNSALKIILCVAASAGVMGGVQAAEADEYPTRPIRIIVPFAAGGGVDATARIIGEQIAKKLGKPVYIENKPGAGGLIGVRQTIAAPADGYTLLLSAAGEVVINPVFNKEAGYDPSKDLVPVAVVVRAPNLLAVGTEVPVKSVAELIEYGRKHPGELTYSSSGVGTIQHITGEIFSKVAGIEARHVPYSGAAPATLDVASNQVSMTFSSPGAVMPFAQKGQLRVLAVAMSKRYSELAELPSIKESPGMSAFNVESWFALFAPAGVPSSIITRLNAEVREAMHKPEVAEKLIKNVGIPSFEDETQAKAFIDEEIARYSTIVKELNIRP
ncbi:Bug family tripartite tricarboxylate transporter substrate binding protein [Advenella kashmirensis]|uniref:Bug family tripartite tricarboxylate transporter substrate binding protein n=1 Tax=Advenella kashmirensis TaxID=310575 RepID=UPI00041E6260|nr:tripartite tricarboxylate transporter substrate binding protein [Advenella kashmirensis]